MARFIVRRLLIMIPTMILVSIICFAVIQVQPGDFGTQFFQNPRVTPQMVAQLRERLGLDQPAYIQYWNWVKGIVLHGDFGYSFAYKRPVADLIWERLGWTVVVAGSTMIFTWLASIPLGIYSATHKYSFLDNLFTFVGFIGLAIPNFFLALLLMFLLLQVGGTAVGGLFSAEFIGEPWSWAKWEDMFKHLWIPIVAIGTAGIAGLMRQMRGNLLDVLDEQYVMTARAKGLKERIVIYKHATRNAINPMISLFGLTFPEIIGGEIISSIVLNLPTMGPFFYDALINQDQYLVMTFLMFSALLMLVGNFVADLLLAWTNPVIRYR